MRGGEIGAFVDFFPDVREESDKRIARIAARQHGVISAAQLRASGISSSGIDRRVQSARLHRIHRGVYAVGHPRLGNEGRWMAAVLACGDGAVLSHRSAAELWGVRRPSQGAVNITVPGTAGSKSRRGITLHRSSTLTASDCTRRDGIPVTKPARTLADLRAVLSPPQLAAARREAEFRRLLVETPPFVDRARTDLEQLFVALCRHHRLPKPAVNTRVDRYEVDFHWPYCRLIVEVDGWDSHRTRSAFEEDRARDARLKVLGYEVVRFTWRQISGDHPGVAATIRALLDSRRR